MNSLFTKILYEMEEQRDTMLVTIIEADGSAPRGVGAQMLVGTAGQLMGTIGGGPGEKHAEIMAIEMIQKKCSGIHDFHFNVKDTDSLGSVCGGDIRVQFQYIPWDSTEWKALAAAVCDSISAKSAGWLILNLEGTAAALVDGNGNIVAGTQMHIRKELLGQGCVNTDGFFSIILPIGERAVIFGAGHCSYALAPILSSVGFRVTVFDEREAFANTERFPGAEQVICGDYKNIAASLQLDENDYVVVMTSGHKHDFEVQEQVLRSPLAYCGVIGSSKKTAYVQQRLRDCGISEDTIRQVHSPIGIPIKSVTPAEIAVSITGEMIRERAIIRQRSCSLSKACPVG